jgi:hypothetical protein
MTLATSCLIANLQIGMAAGADKAIIAAGAKVRYHFYVNTLDWKGNGDRLLTCKNFTVLMGGHIALKKEVAGLVTGVGVEAADKFYVRLDIDPVVDDTRAIQFDLPVGVMVKVNSILEQAHDRRVARATEDLWSRLVDPLTHFADKMESGGAFRDSTVRNIAEAVELLPRLNFADDEGLAGVVEEVRFKVAYFEAKSLRTDKAARVTAASEARRILNEIENIRA